jgi:hypothetical protein
MALLLKSSADTETKAIGGSTPLAWAIEGKFETGVKTLLAKGCKVIYWYRGVSVPSSIGNDPFVIRLVDTVYSLTVISI